MLRLRLASRGRNRRGLLGSLARVPLVALPLSAAAAGVAAQEEEIAIPGVSLGFVYESSYVPPIAVLPFTAAEGDDEGIAAEVQAIVARDLDYSDRFLVLDSLPAGLADDGVRYGLWDQWGADWLVTGAIESTGRGHVLAVELHDIVFASVRERGRFPVPALDDDDFRMAIHRVSDAVVEWVTGDPGSAASSILFAMRPFGGTEGREIYMVDSDGDNLRRVTWDQDLAVSPTWAPEGTHIAYTSYKFGIPRICVLDLAENRERVLDLDRVGQQFTPAYHPDGGQIAFNLAERGRNGLFTYDLREDCCLAQLGGGRYSDTQPTYSHDGLEMAFTSNRLGTRNPQIYAMPVGGGDARLLSPYRFGQGGHFTDPDWSPVAGKVAFSGRIQGRRTRFHIFVVDTETGDNRLIQLTREGNNEDPSWAPDGRHIVFHGERSYGYGIFVVDTATGRTRPLVLNVRAEDMDWSPSLARSGAGGGFRGEPPSAGR